jgi:hypothetical protein
MNELKLKMVRVTPEAHSRLKRLAKTEGRLLELFTTELLLEAIRTRELKREQTTAGAAA